jgi:hypothetical protein
MSRTEIGRTMQTKENSAAYMRRRNERERNVKKRGTVWNGGKEKSSSRIYSNRLTFDETAAAAAC